ncbi:hypothetical protein ACQP3D_28275, partial [Escherichia coli]
FEIRQEEEAGRSLGYESGSSGGSWLSDGRMHMKHSILEGQEAIGDEWPASRNESHGAGAKNNPLYQVPSLRNPTVMKW